MTEKGTNNIEWHAHPFVSVIMNCYNGEKYLRKAIDSIFAQTYENWEIVFWDNASTDSSADIARSYKDDRFRYFRGETNVPLGHARNLAINKCRGEFIAFLDCDDLWCPDKLSEQVRIFLSDLDVGLVYSDVDYFNERGETKRLYAFRRPHRGFCFRSLLTDYSLCLSTCVVRRSVLKELDYLFDESLNMCEESDLFLRVSLKAKIDFVANVLAKYRVHEENWTSRDPEAFIVESDLILNKLEAVPEVRDRYDESIRIAREQLARQEATLAWRRGKGARARHIIRHKLPFNLSTISLLAATIVPFDVLDYVYKRVTGVVRPAR